MASAQGISPGTYLWYVPEHEKYGRTEFYSQPSFTSGMVRVTRQQRFKVLGGQKGWAAIEFDQAGRAFVHLRILRMAMYDPAASDPHQEFRRASVFAEEPKLIEARIKPPTAPTPQVVDSKTPAWKRYKDGWNLKPSRPMQGSTEEGQPTGTAMAPGAAPEKKARSKYSLLPPIGSEPAPKPSTDTQDAAGAEPQQIAP